MTEATVPETAPPGRDESYERMVRIVKSIKCHPVRLSVSPLSSERVWLHVYTDVPNVLDDTEMVSVGTDRWIKTAQPASEIVGFAIEVAGEVLAHEFLEWVSVDGERVFDPHLDDATRDKRIAEAAFRVAVRQEAAQ